MQPPQPQTPPPPPDSIPPPGDDALGRRVAASVIDTVLMIGLLILLGVTIGETTTGGGTAAVSLQGGEALLYVALVLLYYFILESAVGKTAGKALMGVTVRTSQGGRPSAGAIAVRTLLRVVDWLPFLYLVGFISVLATGRRRMRLGDLAAKTMVVRG
jgi:uncharacterized RDD family membrane protein YckC